MSIWQIISGLLLIGIPSCAATGCKSWSESPPIEAAVTRITDQVIIPLASEMLKGGVANGAIAAGAHGINPTYVAKFTGYWVTGIQGTLSVGVEGVAGQIQISGQPTNGDAP